MYMNIILILTYETSLKIWSQAGLLQREMLFYKNLSELHNINFTFITFGDESDQEYKDYFKNLKIIPIYSLIKKSNYGFVNLLKSLYFPFLVKKNLNNIDIIKTNQLAGSWIGIILKFLLRKPLIVRTGFDKVLFLKKDKKPKIFVILAYLLTQMSILFGDIYLVTSQQDYNYIKKNYFGTSKKLEIRPNWVVRQKRTDLDGRFDNRILLVGRLEKQKNYPIIIKSFSGSEYTLDIVGSGSELEKLKILSRENNVKVNFLGNLENDKLIKLYSQYLFFIIGSRFEGNSKVILEAMSAGCVVLASNIPNNKEIIEDKEDGYLFELGSSLPELISLIKSEKNNLETVSINATNKIKNVYSISSMVSKELATYEKFLNID